MALRVHFNLVRSNGSNSDGLVALQQTSRTGSSCKACFDVNYRLKYTTSLRQRGGSIFGLPKFRKSTSPFFKVKHRTFHHVVPLAAPEDGITVNSTSHKKSGGDLEEMRIKLNQSFQDEDASNNLVQFLHDAARAFQLALKQQSSLVRGPWFAKAWLGVDKIAWVKTLSYQAAVLALLQAATEIASRGDGRERDVNIFVQRSLLHLSTTLEKSIGDQLLSKDPAVYNWFWSQQHPTVVASFVNFLEKDSRFSAVTSVGWEGASLNQSKASDFSLIMLVISNIAAIMKLGPAKLSCPEFSSTLPEETGRLMHTLADLIPIDQVYHFTNELGLQREFLAYFGPRAAAYRGKNDMGGEEGAFWVDLVQQQLRGAVDKERIWSRLTTYESIEVLERDLAIFGFFIALGRRTQSFLDASKIEILDESLASFLRYLVGGSVLFYPQLASVSTYQLYVEVVCEEMDWLPFYPERASTTGKQAHENRRSQCQSAAKMEAITIALDVCSHWVQSFIKYSVWLEKPSNIKAARFLSTSHSKLEECRKALHISAAAAAAGSDDDMDQEIVAGKDSQWNAGEQTPSKVYIPIEEIDLFDKELQSVEEALNRLEGLLKELHVSRSTSGKEHLAAACTDLERIRKLKKEAEFLEASLRAKAASVSQVNEEEYFQPPRSQRNNKSKHRSGISLMGNQDEKDRNGPQASSVVNNPRGLRSFLESRSIFKRRLDEDSTSSPDSMEDEAFEPNNARVVEEAAAVSNEIRRFELLQHELVELEKRVQESAHGSLDEKGNHHDDVKSPSGSSVRGVNDKLAKVEKKENIFGKSIGKLKEAGSDVWQGTQLLATDVAAAMVLLRRALTGDELTNKEKKTLQRTLTDMASVIPIGILMLLPVTAVGHAAMLAAIQRYFPALIPSAYARERLDLLRQLEKVREMEANMTNLNEDGSEMPSVQINVAGEES